jgi:hypothetical protein
MEWIMAELVNRPNIQAKLRHELNNNTSNSNWGTQLLNSKLSAKPYTAAM